MEQQTKRDERTRKISSIILNSDDFLVIADAGNFDSVAAASGLALLLKSLNKKVVLYSPQPINKREFSELSGIEDFVAQIDTNGRKLLINFNCPLDDIERVSSSDEGKRLNLIVEFKDGAEVIDPSQVMIKRARPLYSAGFAFAVDLPQEKELTKQGHWVWLSQQGMQKPWAEVNVIEKQGTLSESITSIISRINLVIPREAARNFYLGIKKGTAGFEKADSIALETAAYCLRIEEAAEKKAPFQTKPTVVEAKESRPPEGGQSAVGEWQRPPIFTGTTTPKV